MIYSLFTKEYKYYLNLSPSNMKATIYLRLEEALKNRLREIADCEKRSVTSLIVKILSDYSQKYEVQNAGITATAN